MTLIVKLEKLKFNRELYSKTALIKAAYNYTDVAYIHLDQDVDYYYVEIKSKDTDIHIDEDEFINEMLTQSVRHEVYQQTKNIRELLLARALATSVVSSDDGEIGSYEPENEYSEDEILKDWFLSNERIES